MEFKDSKEIITTLNYNEKNKSDKYYIDTSYLTKKEKIELNKLIEMNIKMINRAKKLKESELNYIKFLLTRTFIKTLPKNNK